MYPSQTLRVQLLRLLPAGTSDDHVLARAELFRWLGYLTLDSPELGIALFDLTVKDVLPGGATLFGGALRFVLEELQSRCPAAGPGDYNTDERRRLIILGLQRYLLHYLAFQERLFPDPPGSKTSAKITPVCITGGDLPYLWPTLSSIPYSFQSLEGEYLRAVGRDGT
eukprot:3937816-Prymnesium_polylepis.1